MFFILSKTLNYFSQPLVIISLMLVASVIIRKQPWKKWLFRAGLGLLLFLSNEFIANEVMTWWEIEPTPFAEIKKQYAYGVILTGVTKFQKDPRDRIYFNRGADRVTHSVQLYKLGIIKKILVSGGSGRIIESKEREADDVASALILMGVNKEDIEIENESKNTHDSALAVKQMLNGRVQGEDCLLITSGYHMRRSAACFKKSGLKMDSFSTDFLTHKRSFTLDVLLVPKLDGLAIWQTLIKEWVGFTAYWISGYV